MSARLADYDFDLPPDRIAQRPVPGRHGSRLLLFDLSSGALADGGFRELPGLLAPGDLLVLNDTRVIPARLLGSRAHAAGARAELLLHSPGEDGRWRGLVRPAKRFKPGDRFLAADGRVTVSVEEPDDEGGRWLRLLAPTDWAAAICCSTSSRKLIRFFAG